MDKKDKEGNDGKQHIFSWATSLEVIMENVQAIGRAGRTRWLVENETFNVLKNQGYEFEHNYGHGKQYLSSTHAVSMMLAFLVDQIQEHSCREFQQARKSRDAVDANAGHDDHIPNTGLAELYGPAD